MRRFAQRLARLERWQKPSSGRSESEWRGVAIRDLIRFMSHDERSLYRDLLIIVRDHFHDFPQSLSGNLMLDYKVFLASV